MNTPAVAGSSSTIKKAGMLFGYGVITVTFKIIEVVSNKDLMHPF